MKKNLLFRLILFHLFLQTISIQSEGFFAETLVKTPSGYAAIEQLHDNDIIVSYNPQNDQTITRIELTATFAYDYYIKITIANSVICCAPDQKIYVYNRQQYIKAEDTTSTDLLMDYNGNSVAISSIEVISEKCTLRALSLNKNHTYCVSHHNIVVHNAIPLVVAFIPSVIATMTPVIKTCITLGATLIGAHFARKIAHKNFSSNQHYNSSSNNYGSWHDPNDPDKNKSQKNDHPHGLYEDTAYHHKNAKGNKSKSPDDGQRCLDYSLPTTGKERFTIEGNSFVILKYTSPGRYHGYIVEWKKLGNEIQNILIKGGFVKKSGKIIKQITEKSLL